MGSNGRLPSHQMGPLPGPGMLHPDVIVPLSMHHAPPGAFPLDMLPPEIVEQKLDRQLEEMEKLVTENRRLATTHFTLRQDLAIVQQELQRLQSHMGAVNGEQEQQMQLLLDKMAKMEYDLQASESIKLEYQQACAEARSLAADREELILKVQQLTQDLQKNHDSANEVPTLMSELESLRQQYQQCRAEYEYERKLLTDHYESLQAMKKNYLSVVMEVENLRAQLKNTTNLERIGGAYSDNALYKENDMSGHQSLGQTAYDDGYKVSQAHEQPSANNAPYGGGAPTAAPARSGYEAPRSQGYEAYDAPRNAAYNPSSWSAGYDAPKGGSYETPRGGGGGYDVPGGASGYGAAQTASGGAQAATMVSGGSSSGRHSYGSGQAPNPYGLVQMPPQPYGSGLSTNPYGGPPVQNYGGADQQPNPYGSAQTAPSLPYGGGQYPNQYGSAQIAPSLPYGGGQYPTRYGSAQTTSAPHGVGQTPTANPPQHGGGQYLNQYGSAQTTPLPQGAGQTPTTNQAGFEAPHGGSASRQ